MTQILNTKVLILNRSYYPIGLCTVAESMNVIFKGHAVILDGDLQPYDLESWLKLEVEEGMDCIGLVHGKMLAPRIIRCVHYDKVKNLLVNFSRQGVFVRDSFTCMYCGKQRPIKDLSMDHVIPRSKGGKTEWTNIVASCKECNGEKADRHPHEAGMKLKRTPFRPNWTYMELMKNGGQVYDEWKPFFEKVKADVQSRVISTK